MRAVPAVRYATGLVGIAAAAVIIRSLFGDLSFERILPILLGSILCMAILVILSAAVEGPKAGRQPIAKVFLWAACLFMMAFMLLTVTAVSVGWPTIWARLILPEHAIEAQPRPISQAPVPQPKSANSTAALPSDGAASASVFDETPVAAPISTARSGQVERLSGPGRSARSDVAPEVRSSAPLVGGQAPSVAPPAAITVPPHTTLTVESHDTGTSATPSETNDSSSARRRITVINSTNREVVFITSCPVPDSCFGTDMIPYDTLEPGEQIDLSFQQNKCQFAVFVQFATGQRISGEVDVCRNNRLRIGEERVRGAR